MGRERVRRVSLSGFLFRRILCCSFVYRLTDFVWWWWSFGGVECLLLLSMCAFSLVVVKVKLFFPLYRRRAIYVLPHTKAKLSSLLNLFLQILCRSWWCRWRSRRRADFSQTLTRSLTIFSFASYHQHQHKEEIYNNAAFPRAIP